MKGSREEVREELQGMVVRLLATRAEGRGLHLIGGWRLRLLDGSPRSSRDVDFHTEEDFETKQRELVTLFRRELLPLVKDRLGYSGKVAAAVGPEADTPFVKTVDLSFFIEDFAYSRIDIPVDITAIEVADEPEPRTTGGVVCLTRSDRDIIESKVVALLASSHVRDRDMVDLFLFEEKLGPDSGERIGRKLADIGVSEDVAGKRILKLLDLMAVRTKGIERVIEDSVEPRTAAAIATGGGAAAVFDRVMTILRDRLSLSGSHEDA